MPRSSAMTVAIRFSKPSPSLSEKGRLSGSAHTRSALGSAGGACAEAAKPAIAAHDTTRSKPRMLRGMRFTKGPPGTLDDEPVPARRPAPTVLDRRIRYFDATFWFRPNTVSTPPCVLNLSASPNAPRAPRPAVGSSLLIPAATPIPAHPPIPERTATYCLPSGPRYVIGLPMIPDGVLNLQSSLPVFPSTALSQPSIVPEKTRRLAVVSAPPYAASDSLISQTTLP